MKIINACWEKRNLGVDAMEFIFEYGDTSEVIGEILSNEKQYNVVKIPSTMMEMAFSIQPAGYSFIESSVEIELVLKDFSWKPDLQRFIEGVFSVPMDEADIAQLFNEIKCGIFNTDRIYLDPHFGLQQSATRYINWIRDELNRGSPLFKFVYEGQGFGFVMIKDKQNGVYDALLGGVYHTWLNSPLAVNLVYQHVQVARKLGFKKCITHLSTNNPKSFRLQVACGGQIGGVEHVFVKHRD